MVTNVSDGSILVDLSQVPDIEMQYLDAQIAQKTTKDALSELFASKGMALVAADDMWNQFRQLGDYHEIIQPEPEPEATQEAEDGQERQEEPRRKGRRRSRRGRSRDSVDSRSSDHDVNVDKDQSQSQAHVSATPTITPPPPRQAPPGYKKCVKCKEVRLLSDFGKHSDSKDGHQSYCRHCKNALGKARRENRPEARLKHHIATRVMKQCPNYPAKLVENLEYYLNYGIDELVYALERDCRERLGMDLIKTFIKGYHLDHKRPLSSFNVTSVECEEFRACWAIENLWMIPGIDNLKKGTKSIEEAGLDG
jgi:hypothetical protein